MADSSACPCPPRRRSWSGGAERAAGPNRVDDRGDGADRLRCRAGVLQQALVGGVDGAVDGVGGERGELVLCAVPAGGLGAVRGGGEHGERSVTERLQRLRLSE